MGYYCTVKISIPSKLLPILRKEYDGLMSRIHSYAMSVSGGVRSVAYIDTYNFAVRVINDIKKRMEYPIKDIKKSNSDALYRICQEKRPSLEERTLGIFDDMVEYTFCSIKFVLDISNMNRTVRTMIFGEEFKIENEFWSESEFSRLEKELNDYEKEMEIIQSRYRIRDIEKRCREIEGRILQISAESVVKAILSEARADTMEDIINAMIKIGWMPRGFNEGHPETDYMGGEEEHDWRRGVYAVLEKYCSGEKITFIVDTVSDTHNQLIFYQHSDVFTPYMEFERIIDYLKKEFGDLEYSLGEMSFGEGNIPEMESAELLGKAHSSDILCNFKPPK